MNMQLPFSAFARPEHIADITLSSNTVHTLPTQGGLLPNDLFLHSLWLEVEGRVTNAGSNNPSAVMADGIYAFIERVTVGGYHRVRAQREDFYNLRGREIYELGRLYGAQAPYSTGTLVTTAAATVDFRFFLPITFVPEHMPINRQVGWLLDCPNYDNLELKIQTGDHLSILSGQTSASTFSAYGSTSGSPRCRVYRVAALGGTNRFSGFLPGRIYRMFQEVSSGDIVSGATDARLFNIPRGFAVRSLLLKTGTKGAGVTSGNNSYATHSDTILTKLNVNRGTSKAIRRYIDYYGPKFETSLNYPVAPSAGYALIDFAQQGSDVELFSTESLVSGPTGDVETYISADIAAASAQAALMVTEEWRFKPSSIVTPRTR